MELSLTLALRSHVRDKQGTLLARCDHEHYFLGYDRPEKHSGFYRLGFGAAELAISPSTLETLRGKCLSIEQLPRLDDPAQTREILVAMPIDESTSEV
jgi:hypothetical protein